MRAASLFAGLGGFDIAMQNLGIKPSLMAEIDPSARAILASRFGTASLVGDATTVDLRGFDLVTAGFPCQGLSNAAATRKHSGLFDENSMSHVVWRALDRIAGVPFVCLENASSLSTARYAADLQALLQWLERHGYDVRVYVLNAGLYGTPMRRDRSFILARLQSMPWPIVAGEISFTCSAPIVGLNGQQGGAAWCIQPSPTKKATSYNLVVTERDLRSLRPEGLEALFGLPIGHTASAGSATSRYQRLGNAVSVQAAECALRILLTGKPSAPESPMAYPIDLTVPMRGGTSGSMVNRIYRSIAYGSSKIHNKIELDYCLPVYAEQMAADPSTVKPAQRAALKWIIDNGHMPARRLPWPSSVKVTLRQAGMLPA